jgi:hypothetical protein
MTDHPVVPPGPIDGEVQGPALPQLFEETEWVQRLYRHLSQHVENERELLTAYAAAVDATGSKAFAFLLELLIADEQRHHRLFADIAASLRSEAEKQPADPVVPRFDFDDVAPATLRDATERILASEKRDRDELKELRREVRPFEDRTLWGVLLELMQRDTDKHIAIIEFVQRKARPKRRNRGRR